MFSNISGLCPPEAHSTLPHPGVIAKKMPPEIAKCLRWANSPHIENHYITQFKHRKKTKINSNLEGRTVGINEALYRLECLKANDLTIFEEIL